MAFNKFIVEDNGGAAVLKIDTLTINNVEDFSIIATKADPIPLVTIKFRANVENER